MIVPYLSRIWVCLSIGFITFFTTGILAQGPLTPPGPPGPAMKTLDQVEARTPVSSLPFSITRPGSYYLTTNLFGPAGGSGILVLTNDVTIDLNGFSLNGHPTGSLEGISSQLVSITNLIVRNGIIRGWNSNGISGLRTFRGQYLNLNVSSCGSHGIQAGSSAVVKQCSVSHCGRSGIHTATGSTITDCVATHNGHDGISLDGPSTVTSCAAQNNGRAGFNASLGSTLANCTAAFNTNGFSLGGASSMVNCTAYLNISNGITAGSGCIVRDCTARLNNVGLILNTGCQALNNTIESNISTGILVTGQDNRIDGNHVVTSGPTGILVNAAIGNIIIRNTCSGNTTNFNVPAGNTIGPIIGAGASLTNASPWANFQF